MPRLHIDYLKKVGARRGVALLRELEIALRLRLSLQKVKMPLIFSQTATSGGKFMIQEPSNPALSEILARIRQKLDVKFEPLEVDGETLQVLGIDNMPRHLDNLLAKHAIRNPLKDLPLWAKIWPASLVLGRFLRKFDPFQKSMLELGAGMGICSLIASRYGFKSIMATDVNHDALDFACANVLANGLGDRISVKFLDVADSSRQMREKPDFVCASELLYLEELHRPLLKFVERNMAAGGKAFFCTELNRRKNRFEKMAEKNFRLQSGCVGVKSAGENGEERRVYHILILEAK